MKKPGKIMLCVGILAAATAAGLWAHRSAGRPTDNSSPRPETRRMPVVLTAVREMTFEERVQVSGNVEAKNTATVSARIPGILNEVFVDEGDAVVGGTTRLFQSDTVKLRRAFESAEQQVAVAAAAVRLHAATVDRVEADLVKVRNDYERYQRLYEQDHAVTKSTYETYESALKQAQAAQAEAKAGLELARAQEKQAQSALAMAQKDLSDSLVIAPITGRVCARLLEPGEMAGPGTPVLRIDDPSIIELTAYLPESYYARVAEGKTVVRARCGGADIGNAVVTTRSPIINAKLRTFEVKALMKNPPEGVVPGARVDLTFVLLTRSGLGAPRESVVRRGDGSAIFVVAGDTARMARVTTGLEADGWVEISGADLAQAMQVVRMGQDRLNDGMPVTPVKEEAE